MSQTSGPRNSAQDPGAAHAGTRIRPPALPPCIRIALSGMYLPTQPLGVIRHANPPGVSLYPPLRTLAAQRRTPWMKALTRDYVEIRRSLSGGWCRRVTQSCLQVRQPPPSRKTSRPRQEKDEAGSFPKTIAGARNPLQAACEEEIPGLKGLGSRLLPTLFKQGIYGM